MLFKFRFLEKWNEDLSYVDSLTKEYREFEISYNDFLKPVYPSITDERKRNYWISKKFVIKNNSAYIPEGVLYLIAKTFNKSSAITFENAEFIKYLKERKTDKLYKIKKLTREEILYSTLGKNAIMSVRIVIKKRRFLKGWKITYCNGYFGKQIFAFMTFSETYQILEARKRFQQSFLTVSYKTKEFFKDQQFDQFLKQK